MYPLRFIDPTGESVYMLFYTTNNNRNGNPEKNADAMFREAALTRKKDIESSKSFSDLLLIYATVIGNGIYFCSGFSFSMTILPC